MQPCGEPKQRVRIIKIPVTFAAGEFFPINKCSIVKKAKQIVEAAEKQNQTAYCLLELESLVRTYAYAEVYAFKALFELAVYKPHNALETLRVGVRAHAEPTELLRDLEKNICIFADEQPKIKLSKPRNDRYSKLYHQDAGVMECCNSLCHVFAIKRGVSERDVLGLGWKPEEVEEQLVCQQAVDSTPELSEVENATLRDEIRKQVSHSPCLDVEDDVDAKLASALVDVQEPCAQAQPACETSSTRIGINSKCKTARKVYPTLERAKWVYTRAEIESKYASPARRARTTKALEPWREPHPVCKDYQSVFAEENPVYLRSAVE